MKHFLLISALFVAVARADVSHLIADNSLDGYYYPQPIRGEGYFYDKPAVRFEEPKQKYTQDGGYDYSPPAVRFEIPQQVPSTRKPTPKPIPSTYLPPTTTTTTKAPSTPTQKYAPDGGYDYSAPSVRFEIPQQKYAPEGGYAYEKPVQRLELPSTYLPPKTTTPAPEYLPPIQYQTPKSEGYYYPKPSIPFSF